MLFLENGEIYSGIIAVVMANLVILLYICMIFSDEEVEVGVAIRKGKSAEKSDKVEKIEKESNDDKSSNSSAGLRKRK